MIYIVKRARLTRNVRARVTEEEARVIETMAELNGTTVSEIIRAMISQCIQPVSDDANISSETTDSINTNNEEK